MRGDRIGLMILALGAVAAGIVLIGCGGASTAIKTMGIPIFLADPNGNDATTLRSGSTQDLTFAAAGLPAMVSVAYTGPLSGPPTATLTNGSYPITVTAATVTSPTTGTVSINSGQYTATITVNP
jgi:hypothetical protein